MAEARTDEEEETREEEQVVRRPPRPSAGGDRPNRHKPEHRHSQGPLSSIRAALKRTTTRSTSVCEGPREREREQDRERERRRPEITILSAEPLASTSWFPGASGGFPPPPLPATQIWGPTIPPPIQPPPSYEEVIREKSQEQDLLPPPSSSFPLTSSSCLRTVSTATSATQTDLGPPHPDPQCTTFRPSRPPRPSFPAPPRPSSHVDDISAVTDSPLTSASSAQTDQWEPLSVVTPPPPSSTAPPRPRPRSKLVQQPVGAEVKVQTLVKLREDGLATLTALRGRDTTDQELSQGKYLQELLEAFSTDDWGFPEDRRGDSGPSQSESEEEEEEEDMATLKARIEAFQQQQTPLSDSCHGDSGNAECTVATTRPEPRPRLQGPPAKPAPPTVAPKPKPHCREFWEDGGSPIPNPEKPPSAPSGSPTPKPSSRPHPRPAPRASVGATAPPRPPSLPGTDTEDQGKTSTTTDTVKTGRGRPGVPPKPSSLMMSSRSASSETPESPSLGWKPTGSPLPPSLGVKLPTQPAAPPAPTPRLSEVKPLPLRPPPIKTIPGRPPPPTINPTSSLVANQTAPSKTNPAPSVSSANQPPSSLQQSPAPSPIPANHMQGQRATKKGPPLPPRPKPGHPLYNSYMKQEVVVVLDNRGSTPPPPQLVKKQSVDQSTCLLDIQPELLPGLDSQSKVVSEEFGISDIQSSLMDQPPKQKDPEPSPISGPRCVARCDYDGQEDDELTFSQGDVIALSELIGQDWGQGKIHGRMGIFPLSFTQVLEPLPPPLPTATNKAISLTTDVTILENTEPMPSKDPAVTEDEWALAVFNFPGQTLGDLSFQQGALIRVLQHVDSDWNRGRVDDREGLYPVAFTQPYTAEPIPGQQPAGRGVAKAVFDFTAESEDELTLKIGDIVREVESLDEQWIVGVVGGKRGIVPKNYISPL